MSSTEAIDVDALFQQFSELKDAERNRHGFIQNLIEHIQKLSLERDENVKIIRAKEMLANTYQDHYEDAKRQIEDLQKAIHCDMFVLVLIDGDNTLFQDDYVRDGLQGGERAARDLRQALLDFLKDKLYFKHDFQIVTKVFLNLAGLSKTYCDAKITSDLASFQQFAQGFNKVHHLDEIIDAGNGKEGADNKIKGMTFSYATAYMAIGSPKQLMNIAAEFNLFQRNLHCKQIILAGSGDNSYGGLLRQYVPNAGKSEKITLIEALPFAQEILLLADRFENIRFDDIFRDHKIINRRVSFHEPGSRARTPISVASTTPEPHATPPMTYAHASKTAIVTPAANGINGVFKASQGETKVTSPAKPTREILVNGSGQRIDTILKNLDKDLAYRLKQRKLCNRYYLEKNCTLGDYCLHKHGPALNAIELEALRFVARQKPCENGLYCHDPDCHSGHRCMYGTRCTNWARGTCWFGDDMHEVDLSSFKAVQV